MNRISYLFQKFKYTHRERQHVLAKVIRKVQEWYGNWQRQAQGFSFFENNEWDVVIILDACRFDTFKKIYPQYFQGRLHKKWSLGSCTPEWGQQAINGQYPEVVYITTNPFISEFYFEKWQKPQPIFAHLEPLWDSAWDKELKTVKPDVALVESSKLLKQFPDKKIVIHLMQPHYPFIGETRIAKDGWASARRVVQGQTANGEFETPFSLYKKGIISHQQLLQAYEDNLHLVLTEIKRWLKQESQLQQKRVFLTADHGNCFGEWGVLEHPRGVYMPGLMQVPWFEVVP